MPPGPRLQSRPGHATVIPDRAKTLFDQPAAGLETGLQCRTGRRIVSAVNGTTVIAVARQRFLVEADPAGVGNRHRPLEGRQRVLPAAERRQNMTLGAEIVGIVRRERDGAFGISKRLFMAFQKIESPGPRARGGEDERQNCDGEQAQAGPPGRPL